MAYKYCNTKYKKNILGSIGSIVFDDTPMAFSGFDIHDNTLTGHAFGLHMSLKIDDENINKAHLILDVTGMTEHAIDCIVFRN